MLETLGEDYVLTARAKGLPQRRIVVESCAAQRDAPDRDAHRALRSGTSSPALIAVEIVLLVAGHRAARFQAAVLDRDYPMLQGAFLLLTLSVVSFNFVADLLYFKLDPRIGEVKRVESALAEGTALVATPQSGARRP